VTGGALRLRRLAARPVVAIVGSTRASDYGTEAARALARGLAAADVTVAATLAPGIAASAHAGVLERGGAAIGVLADGHAAQRGSTRALADGVAHNGCLLAELPAGVRGRRFGELAAERLAPELGAALVVVEADRDGDAAAAATAARQRGAALAAVPGRISSPLAALPHALVRDGATLVRGARDVLELLGVPVSDEPSLARQLPPDLLALLERVAAGVDTAEALCARADDPRALLLGLSRLEMMGVLGRGVGGRYVVLDVGTPAVEARLRRSSPAPSAPTRNA
jgi:DNA processing protein